MCAVANLRGGSEEGESWHRARMREHKQNVFDDFHAAARYLVDSGWTTEHLGIWERSNGGLLVSAALTQRPDLYRAVVCSPAAWTWSATSSSASETWNDEYGRVDDPDEFRWLLSYSPYHHVTEGTSYPATLLRCSTRTPGSDPVHARKLCAALQWARKGPVLLRREVDVGHGAARSTARSRAERGRAVLLRRPARAGAALSAAVPARPEAVVLDYGKVLNQPQPAADKAHIEALAGLPGARLWPVYWAERLDYDQGVLDGPGFWSGVAERLGRRLAESALAELTSADTESWSHLDPVMVRWAASLAAASAHGAAVLRPRAARDLIVGRFAWAHASTSARSPARSGPSSRKPGIYEHCLMRPPGSSRQVPCWWTTARSTSRAPSRSAWAAWSSPPRRPWRATWPAAVCPSLSEQALPACLVDGDDQRRPGQRRGAVALAGLRVTSARRTRSRRPPAWTLLTISAATSAVPAQRGQQGG